MEIELVVTVFNYRFKSGVKKLNNFIYNKVVEYDSCYLLTKIAR